MEANPNPSPAATEVNRQTLTKSHATEFAVAGLSSDNEEVQTFAVRYIANICFNSSASSRCPITSTFPNSGPIPFKMTPTNLPWHSFPYQLSQLREEFASKNWALPTSSRPS